MSVTRPASLRRCCIRFLLRSRRGHDPDVKMWGRLEGGPLTDEIVGHGRPYKLWRFARLVAAGDVVFMPTQGITVTGDGTPCYGCEGSPASMWANRLPNQSGEQ
jgi:hypothetical protein